MGSTYRGDFVSRGGISSYSIDSAGCSKGIFLSRCETVIGADESWYKVPAVVDSKKTDKFTDKSSGQLSKSPHGYVIDGPRARFGGFLGDSSSDENFQHYWMCQDENAGSGGFK